MNKRQRDRLLVSMARGIEHILRHVPSTTDRRRLDLRAAIKRAAPAAAAKKPKRLITVPADPNRVH